MVSAQRGIMTFYQVLSPLCIFFISFVGASFQGNHRYSGNGDKILSVVKVTSCVSLSTQDGERAWTGHRTPRFCSCSSRFTFSSLSEVLELCMTSRPTNGLLSGKRRLLTALPYPFVYLRSILCMAAGMIWKHKWAYSTSLCLNPSVTASCSEGRICYHHYHGLGVPVWPSLCSSLQLFPGPHSLPSSHPDFSVPACPLYPSSHTTTAYAVSLSKTCFIATSFLDPVDTHFFFSSQLDVYFFQAASWTKSNITFVHSPTPSFTSLTQLPTQAHSTFVWVMVL